MKELLGWSLDGALDPWSCFLESEVSPQKILHTPPLRVFLAPSLSVQLKLLAYLCYTGNFEILCKWVTYDLKLEMCMVSP